MRGHVRVDAWSRGRHLWTRSTDNLVVLGLTTTIARLLRDPSGNTGYGLAAIGWGNGTDTPAITDTGLKGAQQYYKALGTISLPAVGAGQPAQVQAAFNLNAGNLLDYAAAGITVTEVGLFVNPSAAALPALIGLSLPSWSAGSYALGARVIDANGRVQRCTTAGATGGSQPTWNQVVGATTSDGAATWTCIADSVAPGVLVARALLGLGTISDNVSFSSTWTLTL